MSSLAHIDNDELAVYVSEKLTPERTASIQSHVRVCPDCENRLVLGFLARIAALNKREADSSDGDERRAEGRMQSGEEGYLQTLYPLSFDRPAIQIVDVSNGGFGLLIDSSLPTGTIVQVCTAKTTALGEVRSCRETEHNQFRLGIRVQQKTN